MMQALSMPSEYGLKKESIDEVLEQKFEKLEKSETMILGAAQESSCEDST